MTINPDRIPAELKQHPQWVCWKYVPDPKGGKPRKVPIDPRTGRRASVTDSATWGSFIEAITRLQRDGSFSGIGFVLTKADPFFAIDIDDCIDANAKPQVTEQATVILRAIPTYTEASPSGTGFHLIGRGKLPGDRNKKHHLEFYDHSRYITFTGKVAGKRSEVADVQPHLDKLYFETFGQQTAAVVHREVDHSFEPPVSDEVLIETAMAAKNGEKFGSLWRGDWQAAGYRSQSEADGALCCLLAFWTGKRAEWIDRLFRQSGLLREKWDEVHGENTYGAYQIANAIKLPSETYRWESARSSPTDDMPPDGTADGGQRDRLIAIGQGADLWHDPDNRGHASVTVAGHIENYPLDGAGFKHWLIGAYLKRFCSGATQSSFSEALSTLVAIAIHEGQQHPTAIRVGGTGEKIYLDLGDRDWQAVEIDGDGWRVVSNPPIKFVRPSAMRPLPVPVSGGSLDLLDRFLNVGSTDNLVLAKAWLLGAMAANGPYPILILNAEQGSGKSTICRVLKRLIDPNKADIRAEPKTEQDLIIAANNSRIIAYDNLSKVSPTFSDTLCRVATGSGFASRQLYTNADETVFEVCRPILMNGIPDLATRPDLVDRAIILNLPPLTEDKRKPEKQFWAEFDTLLPDMLGALCDAVSVALRRLPDISIAAPPRMADFAHWIEAAGPALELQEREFLEIYRQNRQGSLEAAIEADTFAMAIERFVTPGGKQQGNWSGTATELLKELKSDSFITSDPASTRYWPTTPSRVASTLRKAAPALRSKGIDVVTGERTGKDRTRTISITVLRDLPSAASACPPASENGAILSLPIPARQTV